MAMERKANDLMPPGVCVDELTDRIVYKMAQIRPINHTN
jgi:hypothetical protein